MRATAHQPARRRRGVSIIEVVAAIVMTSILLGTAVTMIHLLLQVNRAGRDRLTDREAVARLAQLFRADVRAAQDVSLGKPEPAAKNNAAAAAPQPPAPAAGKKPLMTPAGELGERLALLSQPGQREVEYRLHGERLIRIVREQNEVKHQDAFHLPRTATARVELDARQSPAPRVVSLIFEASSEGRIPGALRAYRIESVLGRDHRFEAGRK